jgi:hypothetical protein
LILEFSFRDYSSPLDEAVGKSGLAVIDMCDNAEVANVGLLHLCVGFILVSCPAISTAADRMGKTMAVGPIPNGTVQTGHYDVSRTNPIGHNALHKPHR